MPAIGITGGVATGKSTVSQLLFQRVGDRLPVAVFSADLEARRLTEADFVVQDEIRAAFGEAVFDSERKLVREKLRALVFGDAAARKTLEKILHPRIREAWVSRLRGRELLLAEIPLLYETQAEKHFDSIIVTACSRESQIERLTTGRNLTHELAARIIDAQMPLEEKVRQADWLVWTDVPPRITALQIDRIISELIKRYAGAAAS
ncbi:MAG: dephospho-CoA kinase [Verrucomicrobia bacterium]|nr:dephospho-CoA kinase [Verrucomicrobiota bacterium]